MTNVINTRMNIQRFENGAMIQIILLKMHRSIISYISYLASVDNLKSNLVTSICNVGILMKFNLKHLAN